MKCAALAVLVLGCGGSESGVATDAAGSEAGDGSASATATVHAVINGNPNVQAMVFFLGADSHVLAQIPTDHTGVAVGPMEPGGYVVVGVQNTGSGTKLDIIADMQPGDDVFAGYTQGHAPTNVPIEVPFDTGATGANTIFVFSAKCGNTFLGKKSGQPDRATGNLSVDPALCTGTVDLVLVSVDSTDAPLRAAKVQTQVGASVSVASATYVAPAPTAYQFANVPGTTKRVDLQIGFDTLAFGVNTSVVPAGTTASAQIALPAVALPYFEKITLEGVGNDRDVLYRQTPDASTVSTTIDLAPALLPAFATRPHWDAAAHAIVWTSTPRGRTPTWTTALIGGAGTQIRMRAPYTDGTLRLPMLPTYAGMDLTPTASSGFLLQVVGTDEPWAAYKRDQNVLPIAGAQGAASEIDVDVLPP